MQELMQKAATAREAARKMALAATAEKNAALLNMADALLAGQAEILAANREDIARAQAAGISAAMLDRLSLNEKRVQAMAQGVRQVAALPDPAGEKLEETTRPNGMSIQKVRVPLGVIGMIYEARPNVTVDSAALALKAGNAILLRGSASALSSNRCLTLIMQSALRESGLPAQAAQLLEEGGHEAVQAMMSLRGYIDVLIPRGGAKLIESVVENAKVPVIETGVGNCHIFVDESADFEMAKAVVLNAKTQRPAVCNAAETLTRAELVRVLYKLKGE